MYQSMQTSIHMCIYSKNDNKGQIFHASYSSRKPSHRCLANLGGDHWYTNKADHQLRLLHHVQLQALPPTSCLRFFCSRFLSFSFCFLRAAALLYLKFGSLGFAQNVLPKALKYRSMSFLTANLTALVKSWAFKAQVEVKGFCLWALASLFV